MTNAVAIVKFIGCWLCIFAVVVLLILGNHVFVALPGLLCLLAIAFAMAPSNWG